MTDLRNAKHDHLYLVCFSALFERRPQALYFNIERPGEYLWSAYRREWGGPTWGMSNRVLWFAEIHMPEEFTHG